MDEMHRGVSQLMEHDLAIERGRSAVHEGRDAHLGLAKIEQAQGSPQPRAGDNGNLAQGREAPDLGSL